MVEIECKKCGRGGYSNISHGVLASVYYRDCDCTLEQTGFKFRTEKHTSPKEEHRKPCGKIGCGKCDTAAQELLKKPRRFMVADLAELVKKVCSRTPITNEDNLK